MTPDRGAQRSGPTPPPRNDRRGQQGGGGGGMIALLPMLLKLFGKNPKLLILLVIAFFAFQYFAGGERTATEQETTSAAFSKGADFDPALYDQALVYEPLADNVNAPLPEQVSLERFAPTRLDQGTQGSCVGWASAYAAQTIVHARATGQDPDRAPFSPSYLYNQIKIPNSACQGSYLFKAMESMQAEGALPLAQFNYTDRSCDRLPDARERSAGRANQIHGFQRLTRSGDDQAMDLLAMKQQLAQGTPVVIGMMVGGSFMQEMEGRSVWVPRQNDYKMAGFGGHAMCVIGYDDYKEGGAFQLMNSWGNKWGENGLAWVRYVDMDFFGREAYAVYPRPTADQSPTSNLDLRFGLQPVDADGQAEGTALSLEHTGGNTFRSSTAVRKGSRFKISLSNDRPCYVYLYGEEADGSSYVLFPYTAKHSPYCGITGTRVFPRDHSLTVDDVGQRDRFAIVVTDTPLDYPALQEAMSKHGGGLSERLNAALGKRLLPTGAVRYTGGNPFGASAVPNKNVLALIIEVDKQ